MPPISEQTDDPQTSDLPSRVRTPGPAEARSHLDDPGPSQPTTAAADEDFGESELAAIVDEFAGDETEPRGAGDDDGTPPRTRRFLSFWARHRFLSLIGSILGLFLVVAGFSYVKAVTAPGQNDSLSIRSVEWLRDNRMGFAVNGIERWWYTSFGKPKEGGDPDRDIAIAGSTGATVAPPGANASEVTNAPKHLDPPKNVESPADTPLPGEGEWQPVGPMIGGIPGMYAAQFRPDNIHTSVLGLAVWMDPNLVQFQVHPGTSEPGGKWSTPPLVPEDARANLVAAFNSGFKMSESHGGFYSEGRAAVPLKDGQGTFVVKTDGTMAVGEWGRDFQMGPDIASARQNLALIVDNGAAAPGIETDAGGKWGATLGGDVLVWRSAVGETADGAIVYVASDALTASSLADMLVRAGAVRGMELDINHAWTTFNLYAPDASGKVVGTKGLPDMMKSANRYLETDSRDFVAVERRQF